MKRLILALAISCAAVAPAFADETDDAPSFFPKGITPHLNIGVDIAGGEVASFLSRIHAGVGMHRGSGYFRPELVLGGTLGMGALHVDDARALDGSVDIGYSDWGPEVQLGVRFGNGGVIDNRLFVSAAYLTTSLDTRLMLDSVDGVGGNGGYRVTIGANWADAIGRAASSGMEKDVTAMLLFLVPQQVEVGWTRSAGSDRVGATFSWGI